MTFNSNDWNNKIKLTIDSSKVDEDLTNFPVLITLSSGTGITGYDTTAVFDELTTVYGSYVNRKKIAVTTTISGVETELYVEIERWDDTTASGNEQAWLWTKVPTIVSGTNTILYLYYDSNHTTNSGYVGDTGETPAQNVWDSNFKAVYHLGEDPVNGYGDANTTHLDEDMVDITDWMDADTINSVTSQVTFDGKSCMKMDTNAHANGNWTHYYRDVGTFGNRVVVELMLYCQNVGIYSESDQSTFDVRNAVCKLNLSFGTDGLLVFDGAVWNEVGTNIVQEGVWQKWVFDIDFTTLTAETVDVYLDDVLQEAGVDCSHVGSYTDGHVHVLQRGGTHDDQISYIDYIKIGDKFINNIKDSTANSNHGSPGGSMTSADLVDGVVDKGLDFDGSNDYISPGDVSMDFGANGLTLESSIKTSDSATTRMIISRQDDLNDHYPQIAFYLDTTGHLVFYVRGITNPTSVISITSAVADYDDDAWKYVVGAFDDSNDSGEIFVNGVSDGTITDKTTTGVNFGQADLQIGRSYQGWISNSANYFYKIIDEVRISKTNRSTSWIKTTYHSNWDSLITFSDFYFVNFYFSNSIPVDLSTAYGYRHLLKVTVTVSGNTAPSYNYDADFYDVFGSKIGSTVSDVSSGSQSTSTAYLSTPSGGVDYEWKVLASSSGYNDTSATYSFTNMFACQGDVSVDGAPASGIEVRLYKRDTGELINSDISTGISGTFFIPTPYGGLHYAIAIHPTDTYRNAEIYDWLAPVTS